MKHIYLTVLDKYSWNKIFQSNYVKNSQDPPNQEFLQFSLIHIEMKIQF